VLSATSSRDSVWIISLFPTCTWSCFATLATTKPSQSWARYPPRKPLARFLFGQNLQLFQAKPTIVPAFISGVNYFYAGISVY
jgi:hypothetical protein